MAAARALPSNWLPRLVVAPSLALSLAFIYGLIAWNGVLSVSASRILPNYEFVGLAQYEALLASERFRTAMANLAIFGTLFIGGAMALGVLLAVLLDQKVRAEGALRTIYLYPMAVSFIVTGTAWKWILNPGLGLEHLMHRWGFAGFSFDWLVDTERAIYCVVIAAVWQSAGFVMALFLAGLRSIDDAIIKAAQVDGASLPRIYLRTVLPSLRPVFFSTLLVGGHLAIMGFDLSIALTCRCPGVSTGLPAPLLYMVALPPGRGGGGGG